MHLAKPVEPAELIALVASLAGTTASGNGVCDNSRGSSQRRLAPACRPERPPWCGGPSPESGA